MPLLQTFHAPQFENPGSSAESDTNNKGDEAAS